MVLQQNAELAVWGWATPGDKVTAKGDWGGGKGSAKADSTGAWKMIISTSEAGGPYSLTVRTKESEEVVEIKDVMLGEVWLCSGQSNMAWLLKNTDNAEQAIQEADFPEIRMFTVSRNVSTEREAKVHGSWEVCQPDLVEDFSAVAYYFGKKLHKELQVPIGLIHSSWGGSPVESWTRKDYLMRIEDHKESLIDMEKRFLSYDSTQYDYGRKMKYWFDGVNEKMADIDLEILAENNTKAGWKNIEIPKSFNQESELAKFDGFVYLRKEIEIPSDWMGQDLNLSLGRIDDFDRVWFNGFKIGEYQSVGDNMVDRNYTLAASAVKAGKNMVHIRVLDLKGNGGLYDKKGILHVGPVDTDQIVSISGDWEYKSSLAIQDFPPLPNPSQERMHRLSTALYNAMIHPLIPYYIRGVIWYQGEANRNNASMYDKLFPIMIRNWRDSWNIGSFPFYYAQIAPFNYKEKYSGALLRESQFKSQKKIRSVGMAVTMDIGNPNDIHPRNKKDVGERLALLALAKNYAREDLVYSGPSYSFMKIESGKVRLFFDHVGGGLASKEGDLVGFEIAGSDQNFVQAEAKIVGETIVVSSESVPTPVAVRYGWSNAPETNLINVEGLPASSFRTDTWEMEE